MTARRTRTPAPPHASHETCIADATIRRACHRAWRQARVSTCEYEDVLQEVRVSVWLRREQMRGKPRSYVWRSAYRAAWRAIRRVCKDELSLGVVSFDAELEACCYSGGD